MPNAATRTRTPHRRPPLAVKTGPTLEFKTFTGLQTKVLDEATGVVEAFVAVTGNTDDGGDVILPGAFNFKRNPKVVWSHDLNHLIGKVLEYEEMKPGDVRLPADLIAKGCGALWFKVQFDLTDPESFTAYRKVVFHEDLGWSIGYEVDPKGFKMLPDGRRALTKVYVWEGSPTTFGMNSEARTMTVKSAIQTAMKDLALPEEKATALIDLVALLTAQDDPEADETKSYPALAGSFEETQDHLRDAVQAYAATVYGERSEENDWWASLEGTFESSVVATIRFYGGTGENVTLSFPYTVEEDGAVLLGDPTEVEVRATVTTATTGTPVANAPTTETALASVDAKAVQDALEEVKKGRVLSAANAAALASAADAISKVLAAAAPKDDDETETAKTKKDDGKKVLAREIVAKGEGGEVETKEAVVPEVKPEVVPVEDDTVETLTDAEALEMLALAES